MQNIGINTLTVGTEFTVKAKMIGNVCLLILIASAALCGAYQLVWNIPHHVCINMCGLDLTPEIASYGFLVNDGAQFQGNQIALIYTPGNFSRLANTIPTAKTPMELTRINGGVPQMGNLTQHLEAFENKINLYVPDVDYQGLLVLDFEDWRPTYRLNFGSLSKYQNVSEELILEAHPEWSDRLDLVTAEATAQFEEGARLFMEATIHKALEMRPCSKAGYYMYPLCFNTAVTTSCPIDAININNNMTWLYGVNTAMFPSIYLGQKSYTEEGRAQMVFVRVTEAVRVGTMNGNIPVWPYATYRYGDTYAQVTDTDIKNSLTQPKLAGAAGVVLWGSTSDLKTADRCYWLQNYLRTVLGPLALELTDSSPSSTEFGLV